jgi:hypothetical protein
MIVCQRQFWMGPHRAVMVARIWAGCDLIHVLAGGIRIKTVRSHLSVSDLARLIPKERFRRAPRHCHQSRMVTPSRSSAAFPGSAWSPWPAASCSPRRFSAAAGSGPPC